MDKNKFNIYTFKTIIIFYILIKLGYLGLEPRTSRLKAEYSTIELAAHFSYYNYNMKIIEF